MTLPEIDAALAMAEDARYDIQPSVRVAIQNMARELKLVNARCPKCCGRKSVPDGIVAGCAYSKPCPQCSGTGKNSPADELLRALKDVGQILGTIGMGSTDEVWPSREVLRTTCDLSRLGQDKCRAAISRYEETR